MTSLQRLTYGALLVLSAAAQAQTPSTLDQLRKENRELIAELAASEERATNLTRALLEARKHATGLRDKIQKANVLLEIRKQQIADLEARKGVATSRPAAETTAETMAMVNQLKKQEAELRTLRADVEARQRKIDACEKQLQAAAKRNVELATIADKSTGEVNQLKAILASTRKDNDALVKARDTGKARITDLEKRLAAAESDAQIARRVTERAKADLAAARAEADAARRDAIAAEQRKVEAERAHAALLARRAEAPTVETPTPKPTPVAVSADAPRPLTEIAVKPVATPSGDADVIVLPALPTRTPVAAAPPPATTPKPRPGVLRPLTPTKTPDAKPSRPKPLAGQISRIAGPIVTVNIGKSDGLLPETRLIVYRGSQFIGYLQIERTTETTGIGAMSRAIHTPQVGDHVTDRLDIE